MRLELCPCCKSTAELRNTLGKTFWVQCTNTKCGLQTRKYGCDNAAEIAMKRWNNRASNEFADGEWAMFDLISSAWFGKRYYLQNEDGTVYSRLSHSTLRNGQAAYAEFLDEITCRE